MDQKKPGPLERRRGGGVSHFPGKAVGGPKSYDSTETVVLFIVYNIQYYSPFSVSVVQWKETFFCSLHKIMETGELFVVYGECDEDRSCDVRGGGGCVAPRLACK